MTNANVTFATYVTLNDGATWAYLSEGKMQSTTDIQQFVHGCKPNPLSNVMVVATYTTRSGRKISAIGWTQQTALRNLARKCPNVA